jgi:transposase
MAYSKDLRERVLSFIDEGHKAKEAARIFKVGYATIKEWKKLRLETGDLAKRPLNRIARIFDSEKLRAYVLKNPLAMLSEIAEHFGGSVSGAADALAREGITLKKRKSRTANETKKPVQNSMKK